MAYKPNTTERTVVTLIENGSRFRGGAIQDANDTLRHLMSHDSRRIHMDMVTWMDLFCIYQPLSLQNNPDISLYFSVIGNKN